MQFKRMTAILLFFALGAAGCNLEGGTLGSPGSGGSPGTVTNGTMATVTRVIDGDTIDVNISGQTFRVRYVGMNTPERDEPCFAEATAANRALVEGQRVRLERDVSDTDRFDRLLRYVYVGDVFVNEELVRQGWAEVVSYPPDTREFENFRTLEQSAAFAGLGCHPTGIFDDGTYAR